MNTRVCLTVLCFLVIMSAHPTTAIGGFELELLMTKLDFLQDRLQEVEQIMQTKMEKMEQRLQQMDSKFETKMHAMEASMKKIATCSTNMSTLSEKSNKILEAHFVYPVRSCRHVMTSGQYVIHVGQNLLPIKVLCEQTKFQGGWTVIQHRFDGSVNFYRNWTEYRNGFGTLEGEFWLGLEYVHQMTKTRPHELLVEMKDFHGNYGYAKYEEFEIGGEWELYALKKLGTYSGTAGNSLQYNKNEKFSTFDRNNDRSGYECAEERHGAWWYWGCSESNLNGRYQNTANDKSAMYWFEFKNDWRGLSNMRIMIRDIIN